MLTAYSHERAPLEEIVVPRYLLYFAIPPAMTTIILSILDPMLGMTLLGVFFVMWVVLRVTLRGDPVRCQTDAVEDLVLRSRGFSWVHSDPVWPAEPSTPTRRHSRPKRFQGHGLTDRHREGQQSQAGHVNPQDVIRSISHEIERGESVSEQPISIAVIGAGMPAGDMSRSYRMVNTGRPRRSFRAVAGWRSPRTSFR
jgi:hypothetical protein